MVEQYWWLTQDGADGGSGGSLFPPETGRVDVVGEYFITEGGNIWTYRGISLFMLFARYLRGEDLTPQINFMHKYGMNVARVFVSGIPWGGEWEDFRSPMSRSDYDQKLGEFYQLLGNAGIRVEAVPITFDAHITDWRSAVQRIYNITKDHWNVLVEVMNEPGAYSSLDPRAVMVGVNTYGLPTCYGFSGPELFTAADPNRVFPIQGYLTWHSERNRRRFPRVSKDSLELKWYYHCPVINDEPFGIAEFDKDGPGARTTDLDGWRTHAAIAHLYSAGLTLHTEAGLHGRVANSNEWAHRGAAELCAQIWKFFPNEVQAGSYTRQGFNDFPIVYNTGDSLADDKAYGSIRGNSWVVVPKPRPGFTLQGRDGWTITSQILNEIALLRR